MWVYVLFRNSLEILGKEKRLGKSPGLIYCIRLSFERGQLLAVSFVFADSKVASFACFIRHLKHSSGVFESTSFRGDEKVQWTFSSPSFETRERGLRTIFFPKILLSHSLSGIQLPSDIFLTFYNLFRLEQRSVKGLSCVSSPPI